MSEIEFEERSEAPRASSMDAAVLNALEAVLSIEAFALFAQHARSLRAVDEVIARLEYEAVRCVRAGDGFCAVRRYDLAAAERERARELRERASALRVLLAAIARAKAKR